MKMLSENLASEYQVYWTEEALHNLDEIIEYISNRWTQREVDNFKILLARLIDLIKTNPFLFPVSGYNTSLRKAVLSRQTTMFYNISNQTITIIYLFNNSQNITKIQ